MNITLDYEWSCADGDWQRQYGEKIQNFLYSQGVDTFVDHLWNMKHEPFEDGYFDAYYDGLLRLFAFMHLSGNYRVIEPGTKN